MLQQIWALLCTHCGHLIGYGSTEKEGKEVETSEDITRFCVIAPTKNLCMQCTADREDEKLGEV